MNKGETRGLLLYTILMLGILYVAFKPVIDNPENYLFQSGSDGLKNYFTITHYVRHDRGTRFSGMNYPYGEHIVFTDNQPVYAMVLRWISAHILSLDNHVIGVLNIWMIFSIFLTGWFVFRILKCFELPDWYALSISVLITFLSPQLDRLSGHYALSYGFYIPAILYYLLRLYSGKKTRWSWIALGLITLIAGMTHLYFLAMDLMMIVLFVVFAWLWSNSPRPTATSVRVLLLTGMLSLSVMAWLKWTDKVPDRPVMPYGIDVYKASFSSVFLPHRGMLDERFVFDNQEMEGWSYVGIFGLFFLLGFAAVRVYRLVKGKVFAEEILKYHLLYPLGLTGVVFLLYSTHCFNLINLSAFVKYLGPLSQFRSVGRFAWVFYYTYLIFASVYLYPYIKNLLDAKRYNPAFLILLPMLLIWYIEADSHFKQATKSIFNVNHILIHRQTAYSDFLMDKGKAPEDFQAILQLPLVIVGPELYMVSDGMWWTRKSFACSHSTGLPLMDIMMSRSSLSQSLDLLSLLGDMPVERRRLRFMDERPVLLMVIPEKLREVERHIVSKGRLLGRVDGTDLYELPIVALRSNKALLWEKYRGFTGDSVLLEGKEGFVYYDNYEAQSTAQAFNGNGAKWVKDSSIFCVDIPKDSQFYELSVWVRLDPASGRRPELFNDFNHDNHQFSQRLKIEYVKDTKGYWLRYAVAVDPGMHHCLRIEGEAWVDAVLVRPLHTHVIIREDGHLLYDNCPLDAPPLPQ